MDHCAALCMMIMASIFFSGLGCFAGLFRGLGPLATGLGWTTENGPTSMSALYYASASV